MRKSLTITVVIALVIIAGISIWSFSFRLEDHRASLPTVARRSSSSQENVPSTEDSSQQHPTLPIVLSQPLPPSQPPVLPTSVAPSGTSVTQPQHVQSTPPPSAQSNSGNAHSSASVDTSTQSSITTSPINTSGIPQPEMPKNQFAVESGDFFFKPAVIETMRGEETTIVFTNSGIHTFTIDELGIHKTLINEHETLTFTPEKAGTFRFYCSIGSHAQHGQVGQLIVKESKS